MKYVIGQLEDYICNLKNSDVLGHRVWPYELIDLQENKSNMTNLELMKYDKDGHVRKVD